MTITTFEDARALVGRTFERDGKRRIVLNVFCDFADIVVCWGRGESEFTCSLTAFRRWLSGAKEVV